jgi:hypothetical protein
MTFRERIKILKGLKVRSVLTLTLTEKLEYAEKLERAEESLNWAIKICEKYASKKEAEKNEIV